jgi:hypothetical protein
MKKLVLPLSMQLFVIGVILVLGLQVEVIELIVLLHQVFLWI